MKERLKKMIIISCFVLSAAMIPFQSIQADFEEDKKINISSEGMFHQRLEIGTEIGHVLEKNNAEESESSLKETSVESESGFCESSDELESSLEKESEELKSSGSENSGESEFNQKESSSEVESSQEESGSEVESSQEESGSELESSQKESSRESESSREESSSESKSSEEESREYLESSEKASVKETSDNIGESSKGSESSQGEVSKNPSELSKETAGQESEVVTDKSEVSDIQNEVVADSEELIGEYAQISSIRRSKRTTGTVPFDKDDNAGNDSSADNNIVRSFDKILYEFELTMAMKENSSAIKTYGGKIYTQAKLPDNSSATWHKDAFKWMEECQISEDGKVITGYYKVNDSIQSAPGSQTLNFEVDTNSCMNNIELAPEFVFYLEGNETQDYKNYKDDPVIVSAVPRYNVQLEWDRGTSAYKGVEVEYDGERNKLYTVGFGFQLYGESPEKGLKGIEAPSGDLTFDIDVSLIRKAHEEDTTGKDVTDGNVRFLSAKPNTKAIRSEDLTDPSYQPILEELGEYSKFSTHLPLSSGNTVFANSNRSQQIYHNGQISIQQNGNTLQVRVSDYAIDGNFPYRWASSTNENEHNFTDQIGYISAGNLFYMVALNDETFGAESSNCYLTFEAKNLSVKTMSGADVQEDKNPSDQKLSTMHVEYTTGKMSTGNYSYVVDINDKTVSGNRLQSSFENGDGRTMKGVDIALVTEVVLDASNPLTHAGYSMNILCKFDDKCYEPILYKDGSEYALFDRWNNYSEEIKFNLLYAGKKDQTGWNSEDEMADTSMQDLIYFDTIQELKQKGYTCVGVMYESMSGILKPGSTARVWVPVHIKETAVMDQVYQFIGNVRIWGINNPLDRSTQTFLNPDASYPDTAFAWKPAYKKTEYDGNGVIVGGHEPGYHEGNSMLIVGGLTSITKSVTDKSVDGKEKEVYDLRNMEQVVSYILYPSFVSSAEIEEGIEVKDDVVIEDVLPKGLSYVNGSCNYEDPKIEQLEDGSTKLKWTIRDWTINTEKEPIQYQAEIDRTSISGTQYKNNAIIHAPNVDNSADVFRTDSYSITVVNLAGHRIFKEALNNVIQTDGIVEYQLNYLNMTDQILENGAMLDILPYNEDNRKTSYHGSYKVLSIYPQVNNEETNYEIYGTTEEGVRGKKIEEINIEDGTWELIGKDSEETQVEKPLTAIYIKGNFQPYEEFTMKVCIDPEDCSGGDWYYNDFSMKTGKDSEVIVAVPVGVQVIDQKITIVKKIKAEEFYEAFGNPFFCFCLTGELEDGKPIKQYRYVEFTKDYIKENTNPEGYVEMSVEFENLKSGTYRVTEQKVLRYSLESIDQISSNGMLDNESVIFQMNTGEAGSAVFTNKIRRWDKLTHTTSVINEFKKKQ